MTNRPHPDVNGAATCRWGEANGASFLQPRQAVVLVGGRGSRLGALTNDTPKPLLLIDGQKSFLDYLLLKLAKQGMERTLLLAGYFGEKILLQYQGANILGMTIEVVIEPKPAGTAGALLYARDLLAETFFLLNGDTYFDIDLQNLASAMKDGDLGALALRRVADAKRYGSVQHSSGRVQAFREKDPTLDGPSDISGGIYCMDRHVLDLIETVPCSIEQDIFPQLANLGKLSCKVFEGYFIDIGLPHTLSQARAELPRLG